ncbi:MAG: hypothetical protein ACYTG2_07380 [Planctomycetota bacterium]|jgi:hypothetical protein
MRITVLTMILLAVSSARLPAQIDTLAWTFEDPSGLGVGTQTPDALVVRGPDGGSGENASFFTATAPCDGTVVVRLHWNNTDQQIQFDWAATHLDGNITTVKNGFEYGHELLLTLDVPAGSEFGLGVLSQDSIGGELVATYSEFLFLPTPDDDVSVATGGPDDDGFAADLAALGDVDGDGVPDLLVGAPTADDGGPDSGRADLLSGADGSVLATVPGLTAGDGFGTALAGLGDIDGDDVPDFAVAAPGSDLAGFDAGAVFVHSGSDLSLIRTHLGEAINDHFGHALDAVPDADGDGVTDLLVGAPLNDEVANKAGKAYLLSGLTGAVLHTYLGVALRDEFGSTVAGMPDADGDGRGDVMIAAPTADGVDVDRGMVRVFSGAGGALLWQAYGPEAQSRLGGTAAGLAELLLGMPDDLNNTWVEVRRGADGTILWSFAEWPELSTGDSLGRPDIGRAVASAGDVDGDGREDFMFSLRQGPINVVGTFVVFVVSGRSGELIHARRGETPPIEQTVGFGQSLVSLGDTDGDGLPALVIGSSFVGDDTPEAGGVLITKPYVAWAELGQGLTGVAGVPSLRGAGLLQEGLPWSLRLQDAAPSASSSLVVGFGELSAPFKGGVLVPTVDLLLSCLVTDGAGGWVLGGTWPAGVPAGVPFWLQAWIADGSAPAGYAASHGVRAVTH